jgi:DNA-directed RNA polymerase specialized sigma24 family protein
MKVQAERESSNIERKLDILIRLVAMGLASDNHSLQEKAVRLQRAGLPPRDIAVLCGSTPNAVRVALSTAKHAKKGRKKPAK